MVWESRKAIMHTGRLEIGSLLTKPSSLIVGEDSSKRTLTVSVLSVIPCWRERVYHPPSHWELMQFLASGIPQRKGKDHAEFYPPYETGHLQNSR